MEAKECNTRPAASGVPTNATANVQCDTTAAPSKNLSENIVNSSKEIGLIEILLHGTEMHYVKYSTMISRPYIEFQYKLINERTTWYIGLQAFFFATFGFTVQKRAELVVNKFSAVSECSTKPAPCDAVASLDFVMISISLAGIVLSILILFLIIAASNPIQHMFDFWEEKVWEKLQNKVKKGETQPMPLLTGGTKRRHAKAGLLWTKVVRELGATIVDPPDEYYDDYYAVFFLDPDGLKLEGMKYGEIKAKRARSRQRKK